MNLYFMSSSVQYVHVAVVAVLCLSSLLHGLFGEHAHVGARDSEDKMKEDLSDDDWSAERS